MHLTPIERLKVLDIYFSLARSRSVNRAKATSGIAAEQNIFISDTSVKNIVRKWLITSNSSSC
jgi:hypothetical protein